MLLFEKIGLKSLKRLKMSSLSGNVVWVTGYSSAGKSTVGRKVKSLLEKRGEKVIFLDGDDLRSIFGGKWGYQRSERIELAHVYFRLCNSLATQGATIVISAVAMYSEVFQWFYTFIDRPFLCYLKVPNDERRRRDKCTKNIYEQDYNVEDLYDEPERSDIVIENFDGITPDEAAQVIVKALLTARLPAFVDKGRSAHWDSYYLNTNLIYDPSSFAIHVYEDIGKSVGLLEVGCGNGRDASYFAEQGCIVRAIDPSFEAIHGCKSHNYRGDIQFYCCTLPEYLITCNERYSVVYSRFSLHAMPEAEEIEAIAAAYQLLGPGGLFYIECRSINDPLSRRGEVISPTERIFGHYRRFIILEELVDRLTSAGFHIVDANEFKGCSSLGDDDPVVIRVKAIKGG